MQKWGEDGNGARHAIACFEQRPVKTFPVKCYEDRTLLKTLGQFQQHGMFFVKIAQEKLLNLQAAGIPPGDAHHERIGSRASREARGLRIEEEPLSRVDGYFSKIPFRPAI